MPRYRPSILISDCWGSVGDLTFYHVDGKPYFKKRARGKFRGTAGQLEQLDVHRRALAAWRELEHSEQLIWHELARPVISHQEPFDNTAHISGHNLFVSAYHGFYTLGIEHIPTPQAWAPFPPHSMEYLSATLDGDDLILRFRICLPKCKEPERYQVLLQLQLTTPNGGKKPGYRRNYLAQEPCSGEESFVSFRIRDYRDILGHEQLEFQGHGRYVLLDRQTGYRNIHTPLSFTGTIQ